MESQWRTALERVCNQKLIQTKRTITSMNVEGRYPMRHFVQQIVKAYKHAKRQNQLSRTISNETKSITNHWCNGLRRKKGLELPKQLQTENNKYEMETQVSRPIELPSH